MNEWTTYNSMWTQKTTYKKIKNKTHTHTHTHAILEFHAVLYTIYSYLTASQLKLEAFRSLRQRHRVRKWELAIESDLPSPGPGVTQNCWSLHWRPQLPHVSCHFSLKIVAGMYVCFRPFKDEESSILEEFQNLLFLGGFEFTLPHLS